MDKEKNMEKRHFDSAYFLFLLVKYKWFVIITVTVVTVSSIIFSLQMDNWYASSANLVPSKSQGSIFENMIGGISSALKEFGMTKLGGSSGDAYDFIVLMQSRTVKDSLIDKFNLAEEYDIPDTLRSKIYATLDENLEISYEKEGNYNVTILSKDKQKAVDMINYFIQVVNVLAERISRQDASYNNDYLTKRIAQTDSTINDISRKLSRFSKKSLMFSPEEQAKAISTSFAELKSQLIIQETKLDIFKHRFGENDAYTKMQEDVVNNLRKKVKELTFEPGFAGNFSLENATEVAIEYMRLLAEFETFTKVKSMLMPMLEEAKINQTKETNSLIIVDPPILADKKTKPKRSLIVLGFMIGTFVLCSLFIVSLDAYKNFKVKYRNLVSKDE